MPTITQSRPSERNPVAIALIAGSYVVVLAILGAAAIHLNELLAATGVNFINPGVALVLALLREAGDLVFDHRAILTLACAIFVLSLALVGMVFGLRLLVRKPAGDSMP